MAHFSGQVVAITGASSGIGRALALALARQNPRLVLAARDAARLEAVAADCRRAGAETLVVPTDVTIEHECREMIDAGVAHFGRLDALVNNAGRAMGPVSTNSKTSSVLDDIMRLNSSRQRVCHVLRAAAPA